jgi:hypothetical protein
MSCRLMLHSSLAITIKGVYGESKLLRQGFPPFQDLRHIHPFLSSLILSILNEDSWLKLYENLLKMLLTCDRKQIHILSNK